MDEVRLTREPPTPFISTLERTCLDLLNGNDGTGHVCGQVLMMHTIRARKTNIYRLVWRSEPTGIDRRVEYQFEVQITGDYYQEIPIMIGHSIRVALRGAKNNYTSVGKGTSQRTKLPLNLCFGDSACVWIGPCETFREGHVVDFSKLQERCRGRDRCAVDAKAPVLPAVALGVPRRQRPSPHATTPTRLGRPTTPTPPHLALPTSPTRSTQVTSPVQPRFPRPTSPSPSPPPPTTFRFTHPAPTSPEGPHPAKRFKANHYQSDSNASTHAKLEQITASLKTLRTRPVAEVRERPSPSSSKTANRPPSVMAFAPHFLPSPPGSSNTSQSSTPAPAAAITTANVDELPREVIELSQSEASPPVTTITAQGIHQSSEPPDLPISATSHSIPRGLTTKTGVRYLALADAAIEPKGSIVSVIGVITAVKIGQSSSTDRFCTFTVTDPTFPDGFNVNLFAKEKDKGRSSTAKRGHIETFNGVKTATGSSRQHFRSVVLNPDSNQLLYGQSRSRPPIVDGCDPFVSPVGQELSYMAKLARWYESNKAKIRDPGADKHRLLGEVKENDWFDCTIEVRSVNPGSQCTELVVTDYSLQHDDDIMNTPVMGELLIEVWGRENVMARGLEKGKMYTLYNVNFRRRSRDGLLRGKMGDAGGTAISPLLGLNDTSLSLQKLLQRKANYESLMSRSHVLRCDYLDQRCSTFEEVERAACPNKFRIRARVVDVFPRSVKECIVRQCLQCSYCQPKEVLNCTRCKQDLSVQRRLSFRFWLLVQDSTGKELQVVVRDQDATTLLPGFDPLDVETNARWDELAVAIRTLLGPEPTTPSDVDMCIKSWNETGMGARGEMGLALERYYALFGCSILVADG